MKAIDTLDCRGNAGSFSDRGRRQAHVEGADKHRDLKPTSARQSVSDCGRDQQTKWIDVAPPPSAAIFRRKESWAEKQAAQRGPDFPIELENFV